MKVILALSVFLVGFGVDLAECFIQQDTATTPTTTTSLPTTTEGRKICFNVTRKVENEFDLFLRERLDKTDYRALGYGISTLIANEFLSRLFSVEGSGMVHFPMDNARIGLLPLLPEHICRNASEFTITFPILNLINVTLVHKRLTDMEIRGLDTLKDAIALNPFGNINISWTLNLGSMSALGDTEWGVYLEGGLFGISGIALRTIDYILKQENLHFKLEVDTNLNLLFPNRPINFTRFEMSLTKDRLTWAGNSWIITNYANGTNNTVELADCDLGPAIDGILTTLWGIIDALVPVEDTVRCILEQAFKRCTPLDLIRQNFTCISQQIGSCFEIRREDGDVEFFDLGKEKLMDFNVFGVNECPARTMPTTTTTTTTTAQPPTTTTTQPPTTEDGDDNGGGHLRLISYLWLACLTIVWKFA